jgi:hypothetical protein
LKRDVTGFDGRDVTGLRSFFKMHAVSAGAYLIAVIHAAANGNLANGDVPLRRSVRTTRGTPS